MKSPISSFNSVGNGPAPTRVVYDLIIPMASLIYKGPIPAPSHTPFAPG